MVQRLLFVLALVLVLSVTYRLATKHMLANSAPTFEGLERFQKGRPGILYFTSPGCGPCQTVQAPALQDLRAMLGERLQIIEVDAVARPDPADAWGVLSLPTAFILDRFGRPRRVNHGIARTHRLLTQLAAIGEPKAQAVQKTDPAEALNDDRRMVPMPEDTD